MTDGRQRVVIERVTPEIDCGRFPAKRVVGEIIRVEADMFCDGHDGIKGLVRYRHEEDDRWIDVPMKFLVNDRWQAKFRVEKQGYYRYTVRAWIDQFGTWRKDLGKKFDAGQDVAVELLMGADFLKKAAARAEGFEKETLERWSERLTNPQPQADVVALAVSDELNRLVEKHIEQTYAVEYERELEIFVERQKALFSSWYEIFPRSCAAEPGRHGTFADLEKILPEIARMGFDVIYLPPVHPIGRINRKGKNNSRTAEPGDHGCPWAIGADEGGHTALHPDLGTEEDFRRMVETANGLGIDIALDIAFQCAPDHPYIREHPEWFRWRPDGSIQYAENPPKKYEDVVPFDFETADWRAMWEELLNVFMTWVRRGVKIFRVDNPHTKPFGLWEWLIGEVRRQDRDVIFLAEAFTRPKVMYRLGKLGFSQSYTYFTWRNTKRELEEYLMELTRSEVRDFYRPNFWPNTPDILHEYLQVGGRPAFIIRVILAATLSSSYGIYGPPYELCVNDALEGKEEYKDSEKYEIRDWHWDEPGNLRSLLTRLNAIRREHPALQSTWNVAFHDSGNHRIICFSKVDRDVDDLILVAVSLDPFQPQTGSLEIPLERLGIDEGHPYMAQELLGKGGGIWDERRVPVQLTPEDPAKIWKIRRRIRTENDFDYYM